MLTRPVSTGKLLEPHQFAALQKLDDPNEVCVAELGPWPRGPRTAEHVSHGGIGSGPKTWCLAGSRGAVVGGRRPVRGSGPLPAPSFHSHQARTCTKLLSLVAPRCGLPRDPFLRSCQADLVACAHPGRPNCSCPTLSEFSRQCSAAGQPVNQWRSPGLCGEPRRDGGEGPGPALKP